MNEKYIPPSQRIILESVDDTVSIRQLIPEDAEDYFNLIEQDRDHLSQYDDMTARKYPDIKSVEESIINPKDPKKLRFGIYDGDVMVGSNNLTPVTDKVAEFGTWIGKDHIGNGYAGRARKLLIEYAFSHGFEEVFSHIVVGNEKSRRSIEKSGFKFEGEIVDDDGVKVWKYSFKK